MKLKELLEKYGNIEITEEKEKELKELLEIKKNKNKWKPNTNELYYTINYNNMEIGLYKWFDSLEEKALYTYNNCFKTKEEAEFRLEQIKIYNELKNFADENNDEMDWHNETQEKYYIIFIGAENKLWVDYKYTNIFIGQIYFSRQELAEQAIKEVGEERIKKYLFGIKVEE